MDRARKPLEQSHYLTNGTTPSNSGSIYWEESQAGTIWNRSWKGNRTSLFPMLFYQTCAIKVVRKAGYTQDNDDFQQVN